SISLHFYVLIPVLPSFPTRRSSDLILGDQIALLCRGEAALGRDAELVEIGILACLVEFALQIVQRFKYADLDQLGIAPQCGFSRSEEHTSELQSRENLVCRLRLEKE